MQSELAYAIARAVRVDFRSEKTREFYGTIAPGPDGVTAITICDNAHFVVEDEDRILDGDFTVLGKVTSTTSTDVPMLERNKILERLKPEGVDTLFRQLRHSVEGQARKLDAHGDDGDLPDDFFDVAFSSRVWGPSFKVIPIAIYA
jgi:hypothetical protein